MNRFGSPPLGGFRGSGDLEGLSMGDPFRVDTPPLCNPGVQAPPAIERRRFQRHHGDRTGICRTFGQEFHFAPYPAWNLSYLRSGISFRSIPCLESVVPSVRDFTSLHTLPGICRTFGTSGFCGTRSRGYALRAPPPAWGLPSLRDCRVAGNSSLFTPRILPSSLFKSVPVPPEYRRPRVPCPCPRVPIFPSG